MATQYRTPGVYITEIDAFGSSVVGVATGVPVFVGYTQFAGNPVTGASLYNTPVAIASMAEFVSYFGGPAVQRFVVAADAAAADGFTLAPVAGGAGPDAFNLYWQMRLFFANGGGDCFIVSVGSYGADDHPTNAENIGTSPPGAIRAADLIGGINAAGHAVGPAMLVVPEACQLDLAGYGIVACAMLTQADSLQDRVAILDLPGCLAADSFALLTAAQDDFWTAIAPALASVRYGAAYAPAVHASIVAPADTSYTQLRAADGGNDAINGLLTANAVELYRDPQLATVQAAIATAFPPSAGMTGNSATYSADGSAYPVLAPPQTPAQWQLTLDDLLRAALPLYARIAQAMTDALNVQPPSGIVAGVWAQNDQQRGVWNAPANVALAAVTSPLWAFTDDEQGGFNAPVNGLAINVLRAQTGRGVVVWGARTLDGNSNDYRYIQVRRELIYIGQSIKAALQSFVFAPNDATTWATVSAAISSFLTGLWQQGGLMGDKASDAFQVQCGVGTTMTGQDLLDGRLVVSATLAITHPAEFIVLTFEQMIASNAPPIANMPQ